MIVDELKKSILQQAFKGNLVPNSSSNKYFRMEKNNTFKKSGTRIKREESLKNIEYKIPENWQWKRLDDLCNIYGRIGFRGYTTADLVDESEGAITLSPSNIVDGIMDYSKCTYISWEKYEESPEIKVNNNDILLVKTGSSYGKNAVVEELPKEATINPQFVVLKDIICDIKYLYYCLNNSSSKEQYERFVIGTSIPTFSQAKLNSLLIPLPPLEEQEKIVSEIEKIFKELDEVKPIEEELESIKTKFPEDMKKSFLNQIFKGKGIKQSDDDAQELLNEIEKNKNDLITEGKLKKEKALKQITKDEIPYEIPNNWKWVRLGDYCQKVTDQVASGSFKSIRDNVPSLKTEDYAIMVKTADFSNGFTKNLTYTTEHAYKFLENSNLFGGELILSNIGSIGKVFIVPKLEHKMTLAPNTVMLKMTDDRLIKYLYYFIQSPLGYKELMSITSGTAMQKLNKTDLKTLLIPIPPIKEQEEIVKIIEEVLPIIESINSMY